MWGGYSQQYNRGNNFSDAGSIFISPDSGFYVFNCYLLLAPSYGNNGKITIVRTSQLGQIIEKTSEQPFYVANPGSNEGYHFSTSLFLNSGDKIYITYYHDNSATLVLPAAGLNGISNSRFEGYKLF